MMIASRQECAAFGLGLTRLSQIHDRWYDDAR